MDEFDWLGIGNGEAIVRHREEGHIYRFKPGRDGGWSMLTLSRSERGLASLSRPEDHVHAALDAASRNIQAWINASL